MKEYSAVILEILEFLDNVDNWIDCETPIVNVCDIEDIIFRFYDKPTWDERLEEALQKRA